MLKKGFTMAEVLMTLGIIGVVAAITLPTLNYNIGNRATEKQILKFYSQFSHASGIASADSQEINDAFFKKNFNVINVCTTTDELPNCIGKNKKYYTFNDTDITSEVFKINTNRSGVYVLADGTVFQMAKPQGSEDGDDKTKWYKAYGPRQIIVDVNGEGTPNTYGVDLWMFSVFDDGSIDDANLNPTFKEGNNFTDEKVEEKLKANSIACYNGFHLPKLKYKETSGETDVYESDPTVASCFGKLMRNNFKLQQTINDVEKYVHPTSTP